MSPRHRHAYSLVELLVILAVITVGIGLVLPVIQRSRQARYSSKLPTEAATSPGTGQASQHTPGDEAGIATVPLPKAQVKSLSADIVLTPKSGHGTAASESNYEIRFQGTIMAVHTGVDESSLCEFDLPLPPQTVSVSDLSVKSADHSSEIKTSNDGKLLWRGTLTQAPTALDISYTAVGKGEFELSTPGGILDQLHIQVDAKGYDLRLMDRSLEPTEKRSQHGTTTYTWKYQNLVYSQPVKLNVLGIAPIDRLRELTWLAPISVMAFGLLVGLYMYAYRIDAFDRWMLVLTIGAFAGAYPLVYFAQDYIPLEQALILGSAGALIVPSIRTQMLTSTRTALLGVLLPGAVIQGLTLAATVAPELQGILLTVLGLGCFIMAMIILPHLQTRLVEWREDYLMRSLVTQYTPLPVNLQRQLELNETTSR